MTKKKKKYKLLDDDKRKVLVYIVMILWCLFGLLAAFYNADFEKVAAYFLSMTAFVGTFIWAESVRQSTQSSVFKGGKSSSREIMVYIMVLLWLILGVYGVVTQADILSMAAYFAALSPFISAFLLGQTYKPIDSKTLRPELRRDDDFEFGYNNYDTNNTGGDGEAGQDVPFHDVEMHDGDNEDDLNQVDKIK